MEWNGGMREDPSVARIIHSLNACMQTHNSGHPSMGAAYIKAEV